MNIRAAQQSEGKARRYARGCLPALTGLALSVAVVVAGWAFSLRVERAAKRGDVDALSRWVTSPETANRIKNDPLSYKGWRHTPLHWAVDGDAPKSVHRLCDLGALPDGGESGRTPLGWAVYYDRVAVAEALLQRGADPNQTFGDRPLLCLAAGARRADMTLLLLRSGADPAARDPWGNPAVGDVFTWKDPTRTVEAFREFKQRGIDKTFDLGRGYTIERLLRENPDPMLNPIFEVKAK